MLLMSRLIRNMIENFRTISDEKNRQKKTNDSIQSKRRMIMKKKRLVAAVAVDQSEDQKREKRSNQIPNQAMKRTTLAIILNIRKMRTHGEFTTTHSHHR